MTRPCSSPEHPKRCRTKQSPSPVSPCKSFVLPGTCETLLCFFPQRSAVRFHELCSSQERPLSCSLLPGVQALPVLTPLDTPRTPAPHRINRFTAQATRPAAFPDASCLWGARSCHSAAFPLCTCCALYLCLVCKPHGARTVCHCRMSPAALGMHLEPGGEQSGFHLKVS